MKDRDYDEFLPWTTGDNGKSRIPSGSSSDWNGGQFPKNFTNKGAQSKAMISRMIFESSAMVPSSAPLYSVMKMLESE